MHRETMRREEGSGGRQGPALPRLAVDGEREAEEFANGSGPGTGSLLAPARLLSAMSSPVWESRWRKDSVALPETSGLPELQHS